MCQGWLWIRGARVCTLLSNATVLESYELHMTVGGYLDYLFLEMSQWLVYDHEQHGLNWNAKINVTNLTAILSFR